MSREPRLQVDRIPSIGSESLPGLALCRALGVDNREAVRRTGARHGLESGMVNLALGSTGYPRVKRTFYGVVLDLCREKRGKKP